MKKSDFFGYDAYTIGNGRLEATVISLGATVKSLRFMGRELVLGFPDAQGYLDDTAYICAAIGRVANRIGGARFTLNGTEYVLPANIGNDMLHGGPNSYDKRRWTAEVISDASVRFTLVSPDGDNGFPGTLTASVTYTVEGDALRLDFGGLCDKDTVYAPTSHLYFNFDGQNVLNYNMQINASGWLETSPALIPTGRIMPAVDECDFASMRRIGQEYDHCFVLAGEDACAVEAAGVRMTLKTDFPAIQVYTSGTMGAPHGKNAGLAIEPELYPDSPNHPEFPTAVLRAGEEFCRYAEFSFSAI